MKIRRFYIIYFPIILICLQVLGNLLYFINQDWYNDSSLYLNTLIGTNLLFATYLVVFTWHLKFCSISRIAAIAECIFGIFYLIYQKDDVYNILFQIVIGVFAVATTFIFLTKNPITND